MRARSVPVSVPDCIFCKIVKREAPASIVYEDETTLAFLDIRPMIPGHTLVIPKSHAAYPKTFRRTAPDPSWKPHGRSPRRSGAADCRARR